MTPFTAWLARVVNQLPLLISISLNAVLTAALLYIVLPMLDVSFNTSRLISKVEEISENTDADVYNLWQIHVAANDRHYVTSVVRNEADRKVVDEFGKQAGNLPFSKVITPAGVTMLLGGNSHCEDVDNVVSPTPVTQQLRSVLKTKHVCFIPIKNGRNELIGYLGMLWKEEKSDEHLLAQVTIARGILQNTLTWSH